MLLNTHAMALPGVRQFPALMFAQNDFRKMKSTIISVLVLAQKYFRKIKRGDCRALSSQGRLTDVQCSHLIARSPCDFCPKRRSIHERLQLSGLPHPVPVYELS